LAKFYIRNGKQDRARELLQEIVAESEGMSKTSYRQNGILINKAKELLAKEL
jgi:FimV-like protein